MVAFIGEWSLEKDLCLEVFAAHGVLLVRGPLGGQGWKIYVNTHISVFYSISVLYILNTNLHWYF